MNYISSFLLQIKEKVLLASKSKFKLFHPGVKKNGSIILWACFLTLLTITALKHYPSPENRYLFSDQAVHIASALSLWHDQDLVYTLADLARFRQVLPAEPGPRGVFLKVGDNQQIYYAKPFLYAFFSAPFVGLLGLAGFLIFNMLCLGIIGGIAIKIMNQYFGALNSLLLVCGLLIFSPFLAWTPIAHPDIYIATLLMVGGYFLLRQDSKETLTLKYMGAFILGLAVYEKPTFAIIVLPLLITQISRIEPRTFFFIIICIMIGWFIPTSVNLFQDGNILSYQGLRFYVTGTVGTFPLEEGWKGFPAQGFTDKVFDTGALLKAIWGNVGLLPGKFIELFIGRQTGLILYFPVAIILFAFLLFLFTWRTALVLSGFIAYLVIYWLAFPTNGYGGSGSYGPRYTMQALPVIIIAFLVAKSGRHMNGTIHQWDSKRVIAFSGFFISVALQYSVLPPRENLVSTPGTFLQSAVARNFPLESSLLPTISLILPSGFFEVYAKNNYLFKTDVVKENGYNLQVGQEPSASRIVIFQRGPLKRIPALSLNATRDTLIEFLAGKKVLASVYAESDKPILIQLKKIFQDSFHDRLMGDVRWRDLDVRTRLTSTRESSVPALVHISYSEDSVQAGESLTGKTINFKKNGNGSMFLDGGWHIQENWGVWSNGENSSITLPIGNIKEQLQLQFDVQGYVPKQAPFLEVDVFANNVFQKKWRFRNGVSQKFRYLDVMPGFINGNGSINISFRIHDAKSPKQLGNGQDRRLLGISIRSLNVKQPDNSNKM